MNDKDKQTLAMIGMGAVMLGAAAMPVIMYSPRKDSLYHGEIYKTTEKMPNGSLRVTYELGNPDAGLTGKIKVEYDSNDEEAQLNMLEIAAFGREITTIDHIERILLYDKNGDGVITKQEREEVRKHMMQQDREILKQKYQNKTRPQTRGRVIHGKQSRGKF